MNRLNPKMMINVPAANATVQPLASLTWVIIDHCCSNQLPVPLGIPSMSGICPVKTWIPTPVRNPTRTDALRKSPRKPSLSSLAKTSSPPQTSATRLVQANHSAEFGWSPAIPRPARPGREYGCGRGVRTDHEQPGRAKKRERKRGKDDGIQAGDDRGLGN